MSAKRPTGSRHLKALTLVELVIILGLILLLVSIIMVILPGMWRRPGPRGQVCSANLKGIGTGLYVYGNENNDIWPIAPHAPAVEEGKGLVTYAPDKIGIHRGSADDPLAGETTELDTEMSTTRNLWILVRIGAASSMSFICPNSDDIENTDDDPNAYWDFRQWQEVSYGYQVPYGKHGQPDSDRDARMVLAADKGPFGASLEANMPHPDVPKAGIDSEPEDWQPWNSPNHNGEGQNVLFTDAHVDWFSTPIVGIEEDNIYTRWSDATGGVNGDWRIRFHGTPPTSNETPFSDTDTLIYP